jgi:hypothetical protein
LDDAGRGILDDERFVVAAGVILLDRISARVLAEGCNPGVVTGDVSIALAVDGRLIDLDAGALDVVSRGEGEGQQGAPLECLDGEPLPLGPALGSATCRGRQPVSIVEHDWASIG